MTRKRQEILEIKNKMLHILSTNPNITDAELVRQCNIDTHTAAKYRKELEGMIDGMKGQIEQKLEQKIADHRENTVISQMSQIWQTIITTLRI